MFCKSKTAYEMRISDWSSDVCSSDLLDVETVYQSSGNAVMSCIRTHRSPPGSGPINRMSRGGPMRDEMRGERRIAGLVPPEKPFDEAGRPQRATATRLGPKAPRRRRSFVT